MRKAQKWQAEELVRQTEKAHGQIKLYMEQKSFQSAMELLEDCQNGAVALGTLVEKTEKTGNEETHPTVLLLEEYCELVYKIHTDLMENKEANVNKTYKQLRHKLIKIENSIKNDVRIKKEIVFLPYKASMWDSLESIWKAADADPDCDAYVIPIPYFDRNQDGSFGVMHYEGDEYPKGIEITDWQRYDFEERRPDVIYIHNPYDDCNLVTSVHPRFYSSNLKKYTDTLVYIPYYVTSGGMLEAQNMLPSYVNIDYIVIQSSQFRTQFDKSIPNEKFLPFGSPKVDRVINKCQNPPKPPGEWTAKMTGKDGLHRRVFFYNTSIGGMLADTENFLKKMQYVFQCFERCGDVCILWRPHPLLESTFHSMRSEYEQEYNRIKAYFIEKEIGILDTTPDIEDSIALSDAYIGEAGTSVVSLFGVAGKPVFILNNQILKEPEEGNWREKIEAQFYFGEQDQFAVVQGSRLYMSEPYRYHYRYFCDLPEDAYDGHYLIMPGINGKCYACSFNSQDVLVIGQNGFENKIELKKISCMDAAFSHPRKYGKYLFLLPVNYPALVRYDMVTGEIRYFTENIDVYVKEKNNRKITGGALVFQGSLYIASPTDNMLYRLDIESGESTRIELPIRSRCGSDMLVDYQDEIWLFPYDGQVIIRWNPKTNEAREYEGFPKDFSCRSAEDGSVCMEDLFGVPAFYGKYVYIPPLQANMGLKLNMDTGEFERWMPLLEKEDCETKALQFQDSFMFLDWKLGGQEKEPPIYSFSGNRLYSINLEKNYLREIAVQIDMDELEDSEPGFCKCSETLPYACFENLFNTLSRFLDGKIVGNPFSRKKQGEAYKNIIANYNGGCGEKVYEFVKNVK